MKSLTLEQFVHEMTDLTTGRDYADEPELVGKVGDLMHQLVENPDAVASRFRERTASNTPSARYMLHRSPTFNVSSIVWAPGAVVAPHNHETWGAIGVLSNNIEERRYELGADDLLDERGSQRHQPGAVSLLIPDDDIHSMHNVTEQDTVEIHVYGKDLTGLQRKTWVDGGKSVQFASGKYLNC